MNYGTPKSWMAAMALIPAILHGAERATDPEETNIKLMRPEIVRSELPDYPKKARFHRIEGRVIVECLIDEEGNVFGPGIVYSDHKDLNLDVLETVQSWQFRPAMSDGSVVYSVVQIPFTFRIGEKGDRVQPAGRIRVLMINSATKG